MNDALQLYTVFGLPVIALCAGSAALWFVRRSAKRVDEADDQVQNTISGRRRYLDNLASHGLQGLRDKQTIIENKIVRIRRAGE